MFFSLWSINVIGIVFGIINLRRTYTAPERKYSIDEPNVFLFYWYANANADWTCKRKYVAVVTSYDICALVSESTVYQYRMCHSLRTPTRISQCVIGFAHRFVQSLCPPFSRFSIFSTYTFNQPVSKVSAVTMPWNMFSVFDTVDHLFSHCQAIRDVLQKYWPESGIKDKIEKTRYFLSIGSNILRRSNWIEPKHAIWPIFTKSP